MRFLGLIWAVAIGALSCGGQTTPKLQTAANLSLDTFMGTWHEVARLPLAFENNCAATSFFFTRARADAIRVESFCWYKSITGPMRKGVSNAYVKNPNRPAELIVKFAGPVATPYHVVYIDPDARYSILGTPNRKHLWILSRTMHPSKADLAMLIGRAKATGFDVTSLIFPPGPLGGSQ